ncbi:hypothetical protein J3R30DRAFT_3715222 [Lentinula aciculospora]|uniref:F-box domain-containing protein n=1 Tax=Lentinula aciculospora TaxID=153920 RepID=A0A9W9DGF1_9AGAR|nr:hypothetical protein J3R30DRAFT_3715222 [Lentinula aciculospora]
MYKTKLNKYSAVELDSMEQKLQISLSLIRGVRNLLQPVNKLPPELLTLIFHQTQQHLPDFLPLPEPSPSSWHWLTLLQVCRQWRGLIASSPQLWSELDSGTLPERFLRRSSTVPLKVYLSLKLHDLSEDILESIASQSRRFRELHLDADSWQSSITTSSTIFHQFKFPAPTLASLTLLTDGRDIVNGTLPHMFSGEMPRLKKLCLKHLTSWPSGYFQGLTHVCLYDQNESTRPTMDEFLDFLVNSPFLEELALVRAGPTRIDVGAESHSSPPRIVSLLHLRQLDIGEWPSAPLVARFLSHIHLTTNTDMYFWGEHMLNTAHPDSEIAGSLALLLPEDISRLENMKHIRKWYLARQPRVILDTPFVSVTRTMKGEGRTLYMYGTFSASQLLPTQLLSRYPVLEVECLAVRDSCMDTTNANNLDVGFWREILQGLPNLQKLEILAFRSIGFTRAIIGALMPQSNTVEPQSSLLCSRLTSLTIEHDVSLPAFFIRTIAEARARCIPPAARLENLRVLVFEPNPQIVRRRRRLRSLSPSEAESSTGNNSESDGSEDPGLENEAQTKEEEEYRMHTEDDRRLLEECVEILGDVQFQYGVPLSVGLVPDAWPTIAYDFTRRRRGAA